MLRKAGGPDTIRTVVVDNLDGSTTRLRTRAGMPEFVTSGEKSEEQTGGCLHGLYMQGNIVDYGGSYVVTGGIVLKDNGSLVPVPGKPPILGDVFLCENTILSGLNRRVCGGIERGESTWICASASLGKGNAEIALSRNQALARTDNVPLHQYSVTLTFGATTQTVSGFVPGLVRGNLSNAGDWGHLDGEVFNQHHACLTDISTDGRKVLVEIHENLVVSSANGDRERISRPLTFVAAYELVISGDPPNATATASVIVRPRPYYRTDIDLSSPSPTYIGAEPAVPAVLPDDQWVGFTSGLRTVLRHIYGVCYGTDNSINCFTRIEDNYRDPSYATWDYSIDTFRIGSRELFFNSWAATYFSDGSGSAVHGLGNYYTDSNFNLSDPMSWGTRYFQPIRLSNRVFSVAVCDVWVPDKAYASPYNNWRLSNRASPENTDTKPISLPNTGSWRMGYDFYYRGVEAEVYPYIYGSARAGTGQVATSLTKTLCWI